MRTFSLVQAEVGETTVTVDHCPSHGGANTCFAQYQWGEYFCSSYGGCRIRIVGRQDIAAVVCREPVEPARTNTVLPS